MKNLLPLMLLALVGVTPAASQTDTGVTTRVTVTVDGTETAVAYGQRPSISADGRYVAFASNARKFVAGDTNANWDVFVRDRQTGTTTRVSVTSGGQQANGSSGNPSISADGRYVAFESTAANLVTGDTNATTDIYVHDRQTAVTTRVSVSNTGLQAKSYSLEPKISADGRYVAFRSHAANLVTGDTNLQPDVFVRDLQANETTRVSVTNSGRQANQASSAPSISADGRFVAFASSASNLVVGDTNGRPDVFVRDRMNAQTTRVSVATNGTQANQASLSAAISADGQFVAFTSLASNLVPADTNANWDVFVHDRNTGATTRVNVATDGTEAILTGGILPDDRGSPTISGDGRYVIFISKARNLVANDTNGYPDLFIRDRQAGTTSMLLRFPVDGRSLQPAITPDGRMVAFSSAGSNLPGWREGYRSGVFVRDRLAGTGRVSVATSGSQAAERSGNGSSIDASGRYVVFASGSPDLVANDTNGLGDVFLRDRLTAETTRVSLRSDGGQLANGSSNPVISANGQFVAFESAAANAVDGDTNNAGDIFVRDLTSGEVARVSVSTSGAQANGHSFAPRISGDGQRVVFISTATNLVAGDSNNALDVFMRDRQTGQTTRVSVADDGAQSNGESARAAISADGRFVAFASLASNLVPNSPSSTLGVFVRELQAGRTTRVDMASDGSRGTGHAAYPDISADGRYVVFESNIALVPDDTNAAWDVFVRDRTSGETTRVSLATGGGQSNGTSSFASISGDGRSVAFESQATNLVPDDTNAQMDIFIHDRAMGQTRRASVRTEQPESVALERIEATGGESRLPRLNHNGRVLVFESAAVDLVRNDTNAVTDVFVNDRGPW